jgi:tetratricopeptide (TPR) repeat protein
MKEEARMREHECRTRVPLDEGDALDFEIEFYRGIVAQAPGYVDALMLLGEACARKGLRAEGLEVDRRLSTLRPGDPVVHYNLACSCSLARRRKEALESLERAIELGYCDLAHIARDRDLAYLHGDRSFHRLLRRIEEKLLGMIRQRSGIQPTTRP